MLGDRRGLEHVSRLLQVALCRLDRPRPMKIGTQSSDSSTGVSVPSSENAR